MSYLFNIQSYSMIVLYSKDNEGVGVARDKLAPENLPQFPLMIT